MEELEGLRHRIERLERERRWWRWGAAGVLLVAVAVVAWSASPPALTSRVASRAPVVEAERLVIRDAAGTERGMFGLVPGTGALALVLNDEEGRRANGIANNIVLALGPDGSPMFEIYDAARRRIWQAFRCEACWYP